MLKRALLLAGLLVVVSLILVACSGAEGDAAAARGAEMFTKSVIGSEAGCSVCHSINAGTVLVGPSLAGIGDTAATRVPGLSAEEYLKESIISPDAYLLEGYPTSTMPAGYGEALTEAELSDLVAYLLALK